MQDKQLAHSDHAQSDSCFALSLLVHDMDVPSNVGSIFRLADALGIEHLYFSGNSVLPPNNKIRKTSRSTEKYVSYSYTENPLEIVKMLREKGERIISLELTQKSIALTHMELHRLDRVCLILGNESAGVSQALLDHSDFVVHIPMHGHNSSMNVATACAIASYHITAQLESKRI